MMLICWNLSLFVFLVPLCLFLFWRKQKIERAYQIARRVPPSSSPLIIFPLFRPLFSLPPFFFLTPSLPPSLLCPHRDVRSNPSLSGTLPDAWSTMTRLQELWVDLAASVPPRPYFFCFLFFSFVHLCPLPSFPALSYEIFLFVFNCVDPRCLCSSKCGLCVYVYVCAFFPCSVLTVRSHVLFCSRSERHVPFKQ